MSSIGSVQFRVGAFLFVSIGNCEEEVKWGQDQLDSWFYLWPIELWDLWIVIVKWNVFISLSLDRREMAKELEISFCATSSSEKIPLGAVDKLVFDWNY